MDLVANAEGICASLNSIDDPIVYQLVRVQGDGTLVPATDDDVLQVEQMLYGGNNEIASTGSARNKDGSVSTELLSSEKSDLDSPEGLSRSKITDVNSRKMNARLEYVKLMLQKVKQDENFRLSDESFGGQEPGSDLLASRHPVYEDSTWAKAESLSSKGEICLDKLTIRELQAVFKDTFGRGTSVKDKSWLKRWIAMGLADFFDPSIRSCTIEEKTTAQKKVKEAACRVGRCELKDGPQHVDEVTTPVDDEHRHSLPECNNQIEEEKQILKKEPTRESDVNYENLCIKQTAAKRLRKPPRRYIEEHSQFPTRDCTEGVSSSVEDSNLVHTSPRPLIMPGHYTICNGKSFETRHDSLGGSSIQIPYTCRLRRGRPRKDCMTLIECRSGQMVAKLAKKAIGNCASQQDGESGNIVWKSRTHPTRILHRTIVHMEEERDATEANDGEEEDPAHGNLNSSGDNSDDYADTVPIKSCIRRKHHRAWTLCEVMKLVEGVARYGTGRWSKIRALAFASHGYRTSVDLKDKWRNLLKASIAQGPSERENTNCRKYSASPLPTALLSRVRELAQIDSKAATSFGTNKPAETRNRITTVHQRYRSIASP